MPLAVDTDIFAEAINNAFGNVVNSLQTMLEILVLVMWLLMNGLSLKTQAFCRKVYYVITTFYRLMHVMLHL